MLFGWCRLQWIRQSIQANSLKSAFDQSQFINGYSGDDSRIRFEWNGKHGDAFSDTNSEFRDQIVAQVIADPVGVPVILLADLFDAITLCSQEAWSIDDRIEQIARLLLNNGGAAEARRYITGSMRSFDANCATSFAGCRRDVAEECLALAGRELDNAVGEDSRHFWEFAVERFELLLKHSVDE